MTPAQRAKAKFALKLKTKHLCRRCARPLVDPGVSSCETCGVILKASAQRRYARYQVKGHLFTWRVLKYASAMAQRGMA